VGFLLGGLVAGEGSFCVSRVRPDYANGDPRVRFVFELTMAQRDLPLLVSLRNFLGIGSIVKRRSRNPRWQPTASFAVRSRRQIHSHVIPFAEAFILPSAKRAQFELWRQALLAYEIEHPSKWAKGRSRCKVDGCPDLVRGRGLCRKHYYRETGY
jgi:hypothetical protein